MIRFRFAGEDKFKAPPNPPWVITFKMNYYGKNEDE